MAFAEELKKPENHLGDFHSFLPFLLRYDLFELTHEIFITHILLYIRETDFIELMFQIIETHFKFLFQNLEEIILFIFLQKLEKFLLCEFIASIKNGNGQ